MPQSERIPRARNSREPPAIEIRAGNSPERVEVPLARRAHDLRGKGWRRRLAIPAPGLSLTIEIVPQGLLIEARLRVTRLVGAGGPKTRAVGRKHFVDQRDSSARIAAELELRIGND